MKIDRSDMHSILRRFPDQFARGFDIGRAVTIRGKVDRVVIAGMGGSALPADILDLHCGPLAAPLEICRGYRALGPLGPRTLVFASSFSGNTEETLSVFKQALAAKSKIVAVTTGGKLGAAAAKAGWPVARIPEDPAGFQPRFGTGYFFAIYAGGLSRMGLLSLGSRTLPSLARFLEGRMPSLERAGKRLASKLVGRIPLVYASELYGRSLARITKIKFNENAKVAAFWNAFPELNHNELEGFGNEPHPFHFILFRDFGEDARILRRMAIFGRQLRRQGYPVTVFDLPGETDLQRVYAGLVWGDWVTYYLALRRGIDPAPVPFIEAFKAAMRR